MSKKSLARLIRMVTGTFSQGRDDGFAVETSLTKFEKFIHFWVLVGQSFQRNRCPVRASALSYTTLLALIPMLAVAMSVSSMFLKSKGEEQIERFVQSFVDNVVPAAAAVELDDWANPDLGPAESNPPDGTNSTSTVTTPNSTNTPTAEIVAEARVKRSLAKVAAERIHGFVKRTYSGTLGFTGMFFLVLTAILTLTRVEETFNDIWGVTRGRDWLSRVANYFTAIALGPAMLMAALTLMTGSYFEKTKNFLGLVPFLEPLVSTFLPVVVICLTFALFYKLVPNTKVNFSAALIGGTLAGVAWHFYNQLGFLLASRAVSANAIYGGLALIPLFMGGLYVVWLTVLFGAQVAYAFQNRASYLQEKLADNVNQRGREFVALRLMTCIGQRFHRGLPPVTLSEISAELGIPGKLAQQVLHTLIAARLVVEVAGTEAGYSPARPLESINTHHILLAMRATQGQELVTRDEPVRAEVLGEFARIQAAEKEAASTVTMLALVHRAQARVEHAVLPAPPPSLVTTLTPAGLSEEPAPTAAEIPKPPAPIKTASADALEQESKPVPEAPREEPPAKSPAHVAPIVPLAASTTDEKESFPL